jgi:uncharacterized protein YjbI with pentapeptide repeats
MRFGHPDRRAAALEGAHLVEASLREVSLFGCWAKDGDFQGAKLSEGTWTLRI